MLVFGRFLCPAHLPAHPAHLWRSAAAAHGGVRQCSRSAARTRKSPVFARLSPFSNARPNARTPSVKRERPEALETRRRRKKTPEQRRAAVVIDTERARRRRGVGSNFRRFSELTAPRNPLISLPFSAYPTFSRPVPFTLTFLTLISLRHSLIHNGLHRTRTTSPISFSTGMCGTMPSVMVVQLIGMTANLYCGLLRQFFRNMTSNP